MEDTAVFIFFNLLFTCTIYKFAFAIFTQTSFIFVAGMTFGILHKAMRIVFRTMIIVEISMNELMTYDKREIVLVFHTVGRYNAGISRYQTESLNAPVFLSADTT